MIRNIIISSDLNDLYIITFITWKSYFISSQNQSFEMEIVIEKSKYDLIILINL